jgi:phosphatidate cytidylyltransferase
MIALLVYGPDWLLILFFMVLVGFGTYEAALMLMPRLEGAFRPGAALREKPPAWMVPVAVFLSCLIFVGSSAYSEGAGRGMVLAGLLGSILLGSFLAPDNETAFARTMGLLITIVYGSFPWLATWDLFLMGDGARYVLFLCTVVWAGDTGAYFGGRQFGRHKLAPRMSPKKTWEGSLVGLACSLMGGVVANLVYQNSLASWTAIILASLFGGAFGQMGDLVESTLKRFSGVKDSGVIFPGHGGFLDRVDGLLFAAPIIWFILYNLGQ